MCHGDDDLAATLQYSVRVAPSVVNGTGLTGKYDLTLTWTPDAPAGTPPAPDAVPLVHALRDQLGLRLQARDHMVDVVVVDSASRPDAD
jgi:uncharacterized protein (TIGR03435 family)